MRVASTSTWEAGMSVGPGAIGVNNDVDALIVIYVLRGWMVYDRLPFSMPRSLIVIATWRRAESLYYAVDPLGIVLIPVRHDYTSADCLPVSVACVSRV